MAVKQYKSTALTIFVLSLVVVFGIGLLVDPDSSASDRIVGVVLLVVGLASGVGLWSLATKRLKAGVAQTLIVLGLIGAGVMAIGAMVEDFAFFGWVFGPLLVLAVLALWLGIVNRGLQTELAS